MFSVCAVSEMCGAQCVQSVRCVVFSVCAVSEMCGVHCVQSVRCVVFNVCTVSEVCAVHFLCQWMNPRTLVTLDKAEKIHILDVRSEEELEVSVSVIVSLPT